jgi:hypothetical protein
VEGEYFDCSSVISPTQLGKARRSAGTIRDQRRVRDRRAPFLSPDFMTANGTMPELELQVGSQSTQSFAVGIEKLNIQYQLRRNCPPCDVVDIPTNNASGRWSSRCSSTSPLARATRPKWDLFRRTISVSVKPRNLLPQ